MHRFACMDQKLADFLKLMCVCVCERETDRFNTNLLTSLFKPLGP